MIQIAITFARKKDDPQAKGLSRKWIFRLNTQKARALVAFRGPADEPPPAYSRAGSRRPAFPQESPGALAFC
ncbi:hypothetical protein OXB_0060 [Bacillus sp. OxB-1]|nr:hypothetical protein OXB_0060 [Bacillus sp. OxB-1]